MNKSILATVFKNSSLNAMVIGMSVFLLAVLTGISFLIQWHHVGSISDRGAISEPSHKALANAVKGFAQGYDWNALKKASDQVAIDEQAQFIDVSVSSTSAERNYHHHSGAEMGVEYAQALKENSSASNISSLRTEDFTSRWTDENGDEWTAVIKISPKLSVATAFPMRFLISVLIAQLLFIVSFIMFAQWFKCVIKGPMTSMLEGIAQIEKGSEFTQISVDLVGQKEIDELIDGFNKYSLALVTANAQLKESSEASAKIVEERTRDLRLALKSVRMTEKLKNEMVHSMGHDMMQPLYAAEMAIANMNRSTLVIGNEELMLHCRKIGTALKNCRNLMDSALDVSSSLSGSLNDKLEAFDVFREAEELIETMSASAYEKNIELDLIVEEGMPNTIVSSIKGINSILSTLISNAIRFTSKGGITVRLFVESMTSGSDFVLGMSVSDTGVGIEEKKLGELFTSTISIDNSISRETPYGLGLRIVSSRVGSMGGQCTATSCTEVGKSGSTFTVTIPVKLSHKPAGGAQRSCAIMLNDFSPLFVVVGGTPSGQESLISRLTNVGAEVVRASGIDEIGSIIRESTGHQVVVLALRVNSTEFIRQVGKLKSIKSLNPAAIVSVEPSVDDLNAQKELSGPALDLILSASAQTPSLIREVKALIAPDSMHKSHFKRFAGFNSEMNFSNVNVLLIDDNQINLDYTAEYMRGHGITVSTALGGEEGIDYVRKNSYDAVFLDLRMPRVSGLDVAFTIRAEGLNRKTALFALTAAKLTSMQKVKLETMKITHIDKTTARDGLILALTSALRAQASGELKAPADVMSLGDNVVQLKAKALSD